MKRFIPRLSYANVVSTLCLVLVVGGGSAYAATKLAKNSVGTNQLKTGAVSTAKIKNDAVTGAKVDTSSLGTVPSAGYATEAGSAEKAARANVATTADRAGSAGNANHASTADSATEANHAAAADTATNAQHAVTAENAGTLDGAVPGDFLRGPGTAAGARIELKEGDKDLEALTVPGFGKFGARCDAGPTARLVYSNESASGYLDDYDASPVGEFALSPNQTYLIDLQQSLNTIQVSNGQQVLTLFVGVGDGGSGCVVTLQALAAAG